MPVDRRRLLELAAARLEAERQRINQELAEISAELEPAKPAPKAKPEKRKRRSPKLSAKERKARSERMKKYWAERRKKKK